MLCARSRCAYLQERSANGRAGAGRDPRGSEGVWSWWESARALRGCCAAPGGLCTQDARTTRTKEGRKWGSARGAAGRREGRGHTWCRVVFQKDTVFNLFPLEKKSQRDWCARNKLETPKKKTERNVSCQHFVRRHDTPGNTVQFCMARAGRPSVTRTAGRLFDNKKRFSSKAASFSS